MTKQDTHPRRKTTPDATQPETDNESANVIEQATADTKLPLDEDDEKRAEETLLSTLSTHQKNTYARQQHFLAAFPLHPSIRATCRAIVGIKRQSVTYWITRNLYGFYARYMEAQREALEHAEEELDLVIKNDPTKETTILRIFRVKALAKRISDISYTDAIVIQGEDAKQRRAELLAGIQALKGESQ